jgi:hypothetical protein
LVWAIVCFIASAALLASIPLLFGSPTPIVRVVWRGVDTAERATLERRFGLAGPIPLGNGVWGYTPTDTSPDILRALVGHPAVDRTDGIDARAARLERSLPLSPRLGGWIGSASPWMARATRSLAYLLGLAGAVFLVIGTVVSPAIQVHAAPRRVVEGFRSDPMSMLRAMPASIRRGISRGVPVASPEAVGAFRVVFGSCVLLYIWAHPLDLTPLQSYDVDAAGGLYGSVVRWLRAHPVIAENLSGWLVWSGALFIVGFLTPVSYACFVVGFLLWASILTLTTSAHAVASLAIAMVCLLAARWSDAWSVDAVLRRIQRGAPPRIGPAQRYGFAIWVPRLVFGVTFLAAAWSKVGGGGLDWILNGTVKYYFVSDLDQAFVPWGPQLTASHGVAVLLSAVAVTVESILITAAFSRSALYALLLGVGALSLLAGFALFQGVLWWGWWILLVAFLPWQYVRWPSRRRAPDATPVFGLSRVQTAVVVALLVQQCVMSAFHVEARPMLSAYDMYSATYANAEEFEDATNLVYRVLMFDGGGRHPTDCVIADRDAGLLPQAASGDPAARARLRDVLGECAPGESQPDAIVFEGDRRVFNWQAGQFEWKRGVDVLGPAPADWLRD